MSSFPPTLQDFCQSLIPSMFLESEPAFFQNSLLTNLKTAPQPTPRVLKKKEILPDLLPQKQ